ncbi:MAG: endonuclease V [Bacteroidota bacterium]
MAMDLLQLKAEQTRLAPQVVLPTGLRVGFPAPGALVVTLDVQYAGQNDAYVALDASSWPSGPSQIYLAQEKVTEAYHPGYFAFREGPVLVSALKRLMAHLGQRPDLLIVDGHGRAHPRKFGVASWLGLHLDLPSIGVAKEPLVRYAHPPAETRGSTAPVTVDGEIVGQILRSVTGVKSIFVSPGHRVSLAESVAIALALAGPYRVIEPIRRADQACRAFAKGDHRPGTRL